MPRFIPIMKQHEALLKINENRIEVLSGVYIEVDHYDKEGGHSIVQSPDNAVTSLIKSITLNTSLHSLDFSFYTICFGEKELSDLVERKTPYKSIKFSFNRAIESSFLKFPAEWRNFLRRIRCDELYFRDCDINYAIIENLIESLCLNPWLRKLDLGRNRLKNAGVILVANQLIEIKFPHHITLSSLNLTYNGHGNKAALVVKKALMKNYILQELSINRITYNPIHRFQLDNDIKYLLTRNRILFQELLFRLKQTSSYLKAHPAFLLEGLPLKAVYFFTFTRYLLECDIKIFPLVLLNLIIDYLDDELDNKSSFELLTYSQKMAIFDYASLDASFFKPGLDDSLFKPQEYQNYLKELQKNSKTRRIENKKSNHDPASSSDKGSCIIS